ncbi:MAG: 5-formyltetrahydrofolate cyclo-ligase [Candidatus Hydrogenedentes bacterium]|nr:5-formyltetrahydrofolate cyclo-ligase [Candidatus Hydrogenedentota bacterium]
MKSKSELKKEYLSRRDGLSRAEILGKSQSIRERLAALPEFASAQQVLTYVSMGSEVETHDLIRALLKGRRTVLVPIAEDDRTLHWARLGGLEDLEPGAFGVLEPPPDRRRPVEPPGDAVVIVPCVAFAPSGHRLGHGKGYFDRFLADHRGTSIGLAFETQKTERLPSESHDVPLDIVVTESACYRKV